MEDGKVGVATSGEIVGIVIYCHDATDHRARLMLSCVIALPLMKIGWVESCRLCPVNTGFDIDPVG